MRSARHRCAPLSTRIDAARVRTNKPVAALKSY
jgi:hypothetical protein